MPESEAGLLDCTAFEQAPLPEVMAVLHRDGVSCKLRVAAADCHRDLVFVDGVLRVARSSMEEEKIGSWIKRLEFQVSDFQTESLDTQAILSSINDADLAKEQMSGLTGGMNIPGLF